MKRKPKKCVVCEKTRGKRLCRLKAGAAVCPSCCAEIRNPDECGDCEHFARAAKYTDEKHMKLGDKHFIIELDPEIEEAVDRALAFLENGETRKAEARINSLMKRAPHNHLVQYSMGVAHALREDYKEALACFDRAVEIYPYFMEGWFNKAVTHRKMYDIRRAIQAYQRVIELDSIDGDGPQAKNAREFFQSVEENICKDLGLSLDAYVDAMSVYDESFAHLENNRYEKAREGFLKVLAATDNHVQSLGNLALCHAFLGDKQKALETLDKALAIDPEYLPARQNKAIILALPEGESLPQGGIKTIGYPDLNQ
jgi:tetratricopeptide (TPR) repeat protein